MNGSGWLTGNSTASSTGLLQSKALVLCRGRGWTDTPPGVRRLESAIACLLHGHRFVKLTTASDLHRTWCAILGLNQFSRFAGYVNLTSANSCSPALYNRSQAEASGSKCAMVRSHTGHDLSQYSPEYRSGGALVGARRRTKGPHQRHLRLRRQTGHRLPRALLRPRRPPLQSPDAVPDQAEARSWLSLRQSEIIRNGMGAPRSRRGPGARLTFKTYADDVADAPRTEGPHARTLREAARRAHHAQIRRRCRLASITADDVRAWHAKIGAKTPDTSCARLQAAADDHGHRGQRRKDHRRTRA